MEDGGTTILQSWVETLLEKVPVIKAVSWDTVYKFLQLFYNIYPLSHHKS